MTRVYRHQGGESYRVELVALGDDDAPPVVRLRALLKHALRHLRLKCVKALDVTPYLEEVPAGAAGEVTIQVREEAERRSRGAGEDPAGAEVKAPLHT
jgi:hypothetical protein